MLAPQLAAGPVHHAHMLLIFVQSGALEGGAAQCSALRGGAAAGLVSSPAAQHAFRPPGRSAVRLQEWAARPAWESADMPTYDYRNQTFPVILAGMRRCRSSRPALQAAT